MPLESKTETKQDAMMIMVVIIIIPCGCPLDQEPAVVRFCGTVGEGMRARNVS